MVIIIMFMARLPTANSGILPGWHEGDFLRLRRDTDGKGEGDWREGEGGKGGGGSSGKTNRMIVMYTLG